jgi:hypothetical protein
MVVALALLAGGATNASAWWWDRCDCDAAASYEPAPVYVYDHSSGPTWTGNGWAYLPIGSYYPRPGERGPSAPPPGYREQHRRERPWHGGLLPSW